MSLDNLLTALSRDADAEVESELARARSEAEAIATAGRERIERRRAELAAAGDAERRVVVEAGLLEARREAARELLGARRALVQRVFSVARSGLVDALATSPYRGTLPARVADTMACLGDRPAALRCHPRILEEIQRITAGRAGLRVESDESLGAGFKAIADDGAMEVDCTLEGRLDTLAPGLSLEVLGRLTELA